MRLGTRLLIAISLIVPYNYVYAQSATVVFRGTPSTKISEGGTERRIEKLDAIRSKAAECVIAKQDENYVWVSRANIRLARVEAGSFVTYVALNGAGYIRTIASQSKSAASMMSQTEATYDYVEHATLGLRSVTYYGNRLGVADTLKQ